jgi:hypothetical protein
MALGSPPRNPIKRGASLFYGLVAVVVGVMVYLVVFGGAKPSLGLAAPVVVTLVAGFVLGLFSSSWRIALICSWLIALIGLLGLLVGSRGFGPTVGDNSTATSFGWALLIGGLGGAGAGGYLGAALRARVRGRSEESASRG